MIRLFLFTILIIFSPTLWANDINSIKINRYCSFGGQILPSLSINTSNSDTTVQQAVQRIMDHVGSTRFILRASKTVPNALATTLDGTRYVLYNKKFIQMVNNITNNEWASISILAHEVGHHIDGHMLGKNGRRLEEELAADNYSGFILQKMGASKNDAILAMKTLPGLTASTTHPSRQERIDAIIRGWNKAEKLKYVNGKPFKRETEALPIATFSSDANAKAAIERIMHYVDVPAQFKILAADIPHAAAIIRDKKRYLLYNQHFMNQVNDASHNDWLAISILSHEIAHHVNGHTFNGDRFDRFNSELEADAFSGYILQRMGASIEDTVAAIKQASSINNDPTIYPPQESRISAIVNGWNQAKRSR